MASAAPASALTSPALVKVPTVNLSIEVSGLSAEGTSQVEGIWSEFVAAIPAQATCLMATPPKVVARTDIGPRAAYAPGSATLYVKPGDLDRVVVFHELAHHLDFTCGGAEAVGEELRAAQGLSAAKPWWKHGQPVTWPAEYFANAVAIALGEESRHDVAPATVDLVREWMGDTPVVELTPLAPTILTIEDLGPAAPGLA